MHGVSPNDPHHLDSPSPHIESSPFLGLKGTLSLLKADNKLIDQFNMEEVEPISNMSFGQIVKESFTQGKGVIIGRI